jgi:hypothetical protein
LGVDRKKPKLASFGFLLGENGLSGLSRRMADQRHEALAGHIEDLDFAVFETSRD